MRLAVLALALVLPFTEARAQTNYDLLFRRDTLVAMQDEAGAAMALTTGQTITYAVSHSDDAAAAPGGESVRLTLLTPTEADLELRRGAQHRALGRFPARVGNPMVMYFLEGVLKDVSDETGGSPYYLRNRLKEALARPAASEPVQAAFGDRQIEALRVTFRPLERASEVKRLGRFSDLTLTVVTSEAVPGGFLSFAAEAPGQAGTLGSNYRMDLTLSATPEEVVR